MKVGEKWWFSSLSWSPEVLGCPSLSKPAKKSGSPSALLESDEVDFLGFSMGFCEQCWSKLWSYASCVDSEHDLRLSDRSSWTVAEDLECEVDFDDSDEMDDIVGGTLLLSFIAPLLEIAFCPHIFRQSDVRSATAIGSFCDITGSTGI